MVLSRPLELSMFAAIATQALSEVLVGHVQTFVLENLAGRFDAFIVSKALKHSTDAWTMQRKLVRC